MKSKEVLPLEERINHYMNQSDIDTNFNNSVISNFQTWIKQYHEAVEICEEELLLYMRENTKLSTELCAVLDSIDNYKTSNKELMERNFELASEIGRLKDIKNKHTNKELFPENFKLNKDIIQNYVQQGLTFI